MEKIVIILRKMPYGEINAAEAVRHALGGASNGANINLILVDSGILLAKKQQDETWTDFTNLGNVVKDCREAGVNIYADRHSLAEYRIELSGIIDGVNVVNGTEIADMTAEAKQTMIF